MCFGFGRKQVVTLRESNAGGGFSTPGYHSIKLRHRTIFVDELKILSDYFCNRDEKRKFFGYYHE